MSDSWDDVVKSSGSGDYVETKEGKPAMVHILGGAPRKIAEHWNTKKEFRECAGPGCEFCGDLASWGKVRTAFSVPVYNFVTNKEGVLKKPYSVFKTIKETREAYNGDLSNVDFRISVEGSGLETKYSVIPVVPTKFKPNMILETPLNEKSADVPF